MALVAVGAALVLASWATYFMMIAALARRGHSPLRLFFREHYGVYTRYRALVREGEPRWKYTVTFLQLPGALLIALGIWTLLG